MAMDASNPGYLAGRLDELQRENAELRERLRGAAVQQRVVGGAITEAVHEKEATARMAHQVTVEERATRAAVEVQGNSINLSVILQILNFFMLLVLLLGMFFWLPGAIADRMPRSTTVYPNAGIVVPR